MADCNLVHDLVFETVGSSTRMKCTSCGAAGAWRDALLEPEESHKDIELAIMSRIATALELIAIKMPGDDIGEGK